jgi:hypothetical protein
MEHNIKANGSSIRPTEKVKSFTPTKTVMMENGNFKILKIGFLAKKTEKDFMYFNKEDHTKGTF